MSDDKIVNFNKARLKMNKEDSDAHFEEFSVLMERNARAINGMRHCKLEYKVTDKEYTATDPWENTITIHSLDENVTWEEGDIEAKNILHFLVECFGTQGVEHVRIEFNDYDDISPAANAQYMGDIDIFDFVMTGEHNGYGCYKINNFPPNFKAVNLTDILKRDESERVLGLR